MESVLLADFVDVRDVRMIQAGGGFRLADEAFEPLRIVGVVLPARS